MRRILALAVSSTFLFSGFAPAVADGPGTLVVLKASSGTAIAGVDVRVEGSSFNLIVKTDASGKAAFPNATGTNWKISFSTGGEAPNCVTGIASSVDMGAGSKIFEFVLPSATEKYVLNLLDGNGKNILSPKGEKLRSVGHVPGLLGLAVLGNGTTISTTQGDVELTPCGNPLRWDEAGNLILWAFGEKSDLEFRATKIVPGGSENISFKFSSATTNQIHIPVGKYAHWSEIKAPNPAYVFPFSMERPFSATLLGLSSPFDLDVMVRGARFECDKNPGAGGETFGETLVFEPVVRVRQPGEMSCFLSSFNFISDTIKVNFINPARDVAKFTKKKTTCAALNKVFPGGVAANNKAVNKGGLTKFTPVVSAAVYNLNKAKLDRDKDLIACEK